jgi:hypothetical protein
MTTRDVCSAIVGAMVVGALGWFLSWLFRKPRNESDSESNVGLLADNRKGPSKFAVGLESDEDVGRVVQRYQIVATYLVYENSAFWQRASFTITGQALLIAFIATSLQKGHWVVLSIGAAIAGILISAIGIQMTEAALPRIQHLHDILEDLEKRNALGGRRLFTKQTLPQAGLKAMAPTVMVILLFCFFGLAVTSLCY